MPVGTRVRVIAEDSWFKDRVGVIAERPDPFHVYTCLVRLDDYDQLFGFNDDELEEDLGG